MKSSPSIPDTKDVQSLLGIIAARDGYILELETRLEEYSRKFLELEEKFRLQSERISELERRLGLNSRNSSKPPSSDGLSRPPAPKRDNRTGRKPGGQRGHKGRTLRRSERVDHVVNHFPHGCAHCGHALDEGMSEPVATRQVQDIPEPSPLVVVDHVVHKCVCPRCNGETRASFPDGINASVQYGPNLTAFAVYLGEYQLIPVKRLVGTFNDLFGVRLSEGTIVNMVSRTAGKYRGVEGHIRKAVVRSRVVHMDETGLRIEGRLHWLHVACTMMLTHFRIGRGRGDVMLEALGIVVHDCWKSYFRMPHVAGHGICCAHILRELESLFQFGREKWAMDLSRLLSGAVHACNLADGAPLSPETMRDIREKYDRIVGEGLRHHESLKPLSSPGSRGRKKRRKGHNLLLRLRDHGDAVLLFTRNPLVPATNNIAELDLRMEKVKQKISGCHRSMEGAINRTIIRTVLATARKQGWNMLDTLRKSSSELEASLKVDIPVQAPG